MTIQTGKGTISLKHLLAIWSISAIASLPGLAISPILDDLHTIFPHSSELELQLVSSLPSLLIIPFVLLAGKLTEGRERWPILMGGLALFLMSGVGCLLSHSLRALLVWSCVMG
ncbi:MAG: MFS transporter, partial [Alistipes sp.]|nr:MFS transporter [Alistipes sp.]